MSLQILFGDITEQKVDAIVNPTNHWYTGGGGTDYAIHTAAGPEMEEELANLPTLDTGDISVTKAYGLPATYVLHTVGPKWRGGRNHEAILLRSCYTNALMKAKSLGCKSIAFPLISSGTFRFPADYASSIAVETINNYLKIDPSLDVRLVLYASGPASALLEELSSYIVRNFKGTFHMPPSSFKESLKEISGSCLSYEDRVFDTAKLALLDFDYSEQEKREPKVPKDKQVKESSSTTTKKEEPLVILEKCEPVPEPKPKQVPVPAKAKAEMPKKESKGWKPGDEPVAVDGFVETMLFFVRNYLEEHPGEKESDIYTKAQLTKDHYSKIKSEKIAPKKYTVLSLAIGMELTLGETKHLLQSAGYALTTGSVGDLIVTYFIKEGLYDVFTINEYLLRYESVLLGGKAVI